jgi:hypothetical protein
MSDPIHPPQEDPRLARVSAIALALPETTRELPETHAKFIVRKKTFLYYLDNHHGDGIISVAGKLPIAENRGRVEMDPTRWYLPTYIGPRGWVGLRLDVGEIDWQEVEDLVLGSYRLVAPKQLGKILARRASGAPTA